LLIITFDESNYTESVSLNGSQEVVDIVFAGESCCDQQPGPNLAGVRPTTLALLNTPSLAENIVINGYGGDRIGALLLSPFVIPGSSSSIPYNHYSLLRSLEDIYGLGEHLGYARDNPWTNYFLETIGNDSSVFKPAAHFRY
jgi:hypothetical protein